MNRYSDFRVSEKGKEMNVTGASSADAIKTWPERIYLQTGDPDTGETLYFQGRYDHEGVTWCKDKIENGDVEYVRADLARSLIGESES